MNSPLPALLRLTAIVALAATSLTSPAASSVLPPTALQSAPFKTIGPDIGNELPFSKSKSPDRIHGRRFDITARGEAFYAAQIILPVSEPLTAGDTLSVTFDARTTFVRDESGEGLATVYFQDANSTGFKDLLRPVPITGEWITYRFAFSVKSSISSDPVAGELGFGFGGREQIVELANVTLTNHGPDIPPTSLPQTRATYAGREPDAAWRAEAAERIDRIRKTDLQIRVTDAAGQPVPGARVSIEQQRHAFSFGTAVAIKLINSRSPDGERYRQTLRKYFNHAVIESALKWPYWPETIDFAGDATIEHGLQWLQEHDFRVKGHVLIWPSFRKMPAGISDLKDDPDALRSAIQQRITETAGRYRPYVDEWDVINEPFDNHDVTDILGEAVMAEWFELARQASPDTPLFLNDYGILSGGDANDTPHRRHFETTIAALQKAKAPLGGLGMQSHFGEHLTPPAALYTLLNRYARFGLPIQITEFDVDTTDTELQADYTRDFLTLVFSHPQVEAFIQWGFCERQHWRPAAAMVNADWQLKPNGEAYRDLVFDTWWTKTDGATSPTGEFKTRAFFGDHRIAVTHNGETTEREVSLTRDTPTLEITLP